MKAWLRRLWRRLDGRMMSRLRYFLLLWRRFWGLRSGVARRIKLDNGHVRLSLKAGAESIACCPGDDWERRVEPDGTVVVTNRKPVTFAINEDSDVTHITVRMPAR